VQQPGTWSSRWALQRPLSSGGRRPPTPRPKRCWPLPPAVALVSLRARAFPAWLGWLSVVAAAANLLMSLGIVVDSGPLVPGGALTYMLYALVPVWLLAVTTVMIMRLGKPAGATG
jgi:hypothetical protein